MPGSKQLDTRTRPQKGRHTGKHKDPSNIPLHTGKHKDPPNLPLQTGKHKDPPNLPLQTGKHKDPSNLPLQTVKHKDPSNIPLQTGKHKDPPNLPLRSLHHAMRSSGRQAKLMRQASRGTEHYTASPASRLVSRGQLGRGEGLPDPLVSVKPDNVCTPPSGLLALLPQRLHARPPLFVLLLLHWREVIIHAPFVPKPYILLQGKDCPPRPGGEPCEQYHTHILCRGQPHDMVIHPVRLDMPHKLLLAHEVR